MRRLWFAALAACTIAILSGSRASAAPVTLMDQLSPSTYTMVRSNLSSNSAWNIGVLDDFVVTSPVLLDLLTVDLGGWDWIPGDDFGDIPALFVNVYSSPSAAANSTNLVGNVFHGDYVLADGNVSSIPGVAGGPESPRVRWALDLTAANIVLGPGTYWLSVIADMRSGFAAPTPGFGPLLYTATAVTPGGENALRVNPGAALSYPNTDWPDGDEIAPIGYNAAFRLTADTLDAAAVPEPTTLLLLGTGLAGACVRRRRAVSLAGRE